MKKILFKKENKTRIEEAIKVAEGRATARTLTFNVIEMKIAQVEEKLGLSKKALKGVKIDYTGAEKFPSAYKWRPESTHFTAVFTGSNWAITDIGRYTCPNEHCDINVTLTDEAKAEIIRHMEKF